MSSRMVDVTTPPTMGAAILFIISAPAPWLNMMGIRPARITLTVIILGRILFTAPCIMASFKSWILVSLPFLFPLFMGEVEVEEHYYAGLRVEARQGDDSYPDGDTHVVIEKIKEPEGADERERHRKEDYHCLCVDFVLR